VLALTPFVRKQIVTFAVPFVTVSLAYFCTEHIAGLRQRTPLFLYLTAVLVSAWSGGWFSGFLATALTGSVTAWIFPPSNSFLINGHDDLMRWITFILLALMISSLHASRSRVVRALRNSEERLMLALDSAHLGVWDYNLLTRKFWWSKTLESIYGRTDGDFPATYGQFFGCIHFDDQPLFNRAITRTIDEGDDYEIEHRIHLPDKTIRWVNTRGRLFYNSKSRAERIVGVVTNITDKKQTEKLRPDSELRPKRPEPAMSKVSQFGVGVAAEPT
jgi:PAS domain S-box-containing protein